MKLKICIVAGKYYNDSTDDLIRGATLLLDKYKKFETNFDWGPSDTFSGMFEQFTIVFTALLASIGAAGIPSAGLVMIFIVLKSVGLSEHPQVGILVGTMLAVDRPLDMLRTTINVTSDSIGASIIAKSEGEDLYNN